MLAGDPNDYDRASTIDLAQLRAFVAATQPPLVAALELDAHTPARQKFLARLQGEIGKRGVVDVLRRGVKHGPHDVDLFYGTPSPGNAKAATRFGQNRFSVTRQLRYSRDDTAHALDLAIFVNGLPVATFELKNSLTKQTVADAVEQYRRDRDPREKLFEFGRCMAHFAVRRDGRRRSVAGELVSPIFRDVTTVSLYRSDTPLQRAVVRVRGSVAAAARPQLSSRA